MTQLKEITSLREAKKAINQYFKYHTEGYSVMHEVTDDGYITQEHIKLMDDETIINVANDLAYDLHAEVCSLIDEFTE